MLRDHLARRLNELKLKVAFIDKDLGYELRSADPIPSTRNTPAISATAP